MVSQAVKTIVQELRSGLKAGRLLPINYPVSTCGGLSGNEWQETTSQRSTEPEPEPLRHRERDRHGERVKKKLRERGLARPLVVLIILALINLGALPILARSSL